MPKKRLDVKLRFLFWHVNIEPFFSSFFLIRLWFQEARLLKYRKAVFIKNRSRVSQGTFFLNIVEILSEFPLQIVFCNKTETFHNHFESLKNKQR